MILLNTKVPEIQILHNWSCHFIQMCTLYYFNSTKRFLSAKTNIHLQLRAIIYLVWATGCYDGVKDTHKVYIIGFQMTKP